MREVESWLVSTLQSNSALVALLGKDTANNPAIFPDEMLDPDERVPYPIITFSRIGDAGSLAMFYDQPELAGQIDWPRIAIRCWSSQTRDAAYRIWKLVDAMLVGMQATKFASVYFTGYKIRRTVLRDNMYDRDARAYFVYSEYAYLAQLTTTAQPF